MTRLAERREVTPGDADAVDVELAASGDARAFERLYRRHVARVHSLACWLMGGEDVDDVLQEVFVRVWRKLDTYRGQAAFSTWLHRLATNVILRRRTVSRIHAQRHAPSGDAWPGAQSPPATPGLRVDLEAAVAGLPAGARRVFVLHDVEGFKHEEVADMLGISVGTSRSQLHRARMALRRYFDE